MSIAKEHRWLLLAVCAAQFFMPFMVAGVNAVLPPLGESLGASARELSLLGAVYTLGLVVFQLAGGTLGDIYGRRRVFLFGLSLFSVLLWCWASSRISTYSSACACSRVWGPPC